MTPMKPFVKSRKEQKEFFTPEGCFITELSNSPDDGEISIARARIEPGVTTRLHRLAATTERYCILTGKGRLEVGDLPPREVAEGDVVLIPPLCPQRITNIGNEDLIFLAICTPPFTEAAYEDLDDAPTVD